MDVTNFVSASATTVQQDPSVVGPVYTDPTTGYRHRLLKNNWSGVTGTLGLDWKPDADTLGYLKFTRGYKAGGFNSGQTTLPTFVTTKEETINAYEVGLKKTLLEGRLQANRLGVLLRLQGHPGAADRPGPHSGDQPDPVLQPAQGRIIGFELETIWQPIDNLQILANYSYLNSEIPRGLLLSGLQRPARPAARRATRRQHARRPGQPDRRAEPGPQGMKLPSSTPHRVTINGNYTWTSTSAASAPR